MISIISTKYCSDYLLVDAALAHGKIDEKILQAANRLKNVSEHSELSCFECKKIKMLGNAFDFRVKAVLMQDGLRSRIAQPFAVISGAGISGLAASFELRARGFRVVVVEKRIKFRRYNVINLNVETQNFLEKFNLLEKFERCVASRIQEHRYVLIGKDKSARRLALSDVSGLQLNASISFEPENFDKLFEKDGIYSVPIGDLQTFLAENALNFGVNIFVGVTARVLSRTKAGGVAQIQIFENKILQPDLFFIAEGVYSTTARQLSMQKREIVNACSGENWIFGNMTYFGTETFVVSLVDASNRTVQIANAIFNAHSKVLNIAVTCDRNMHKDHIQEQISHTAQRILDQNAFSIEQMCITPLSTVSKPVVVMNQISYPFSMDNVFCIGDSAGSSSPLAGLGGTLGLTLVPCTVRKVLDDYEKKSGSIHENFERFSKAYTLRWIQKSEGIKKFCNRVYDDEHSLVEEKQNGN